MRARLTMVIGAALLAIGAGLVVWALRQSSAGNLEAVQKVVAILDAEVKQRRAEAKTRAESTAIQKPLRSAIGSDAATVHKQVEEEDFRLTSEPGETLEIGQTFEGQYVELLVWPLTATATKHGMPHDGAELVQLGDRALLTVITHIIATYQDKEAQGYRGYLLVSRELSLAAATAELVRLHVPATLTYQDGSIVLGTAPGAGAKISTLPIPSLPGLALQAMSTLPTPRPVLPMAGGGAAALLGVVLMVLGVTRRTLSPGASALGAPAGAVSASVAAQGPATGSAGTVLALGTPALAGQVTMLSGTPAGSLVGLAPGAVLGGRWELVKRLGSGGMADVYLARSRGEAGFEKLVALKVMHPFLARSERAVSHFLDEARVAAQIVHSNVVQIYDLGKIGEDYVIIMEYVEGANLDSLLSSARAAGRAVPVPVALGILRRICDGLTAAHRALAADGAPLNLVHRDVKSGNVLVSRQGVVKVVDFGIAKAAQQSHVTMAGETKGTPSMMAPEQRVGDVVDQRADVYSTAAVGYELLTGAAVNLDLAALAHLGTEGWPHLPRPSELRPQLPGELDGILLRAMSFERDRRPVDCAAFEAEFEAVAKLYHLECSDKEIARWAEGELALLSGGEAPPPLPPSALSARTEGY